MSRVIHIENDDLLDIKLNSDEIFTFFLENKIINFNFELINGNYKMLLFINSDIDMILNVKGKVDKANLELKLIDLNNNNSKQNINIAFYDGCYANVESIYLGSKEKEIYYHLSNTNNNSEVSISNNVVCLDEADFKMEVIGKIEKNCINSKHFQKSRCLTIGNPKIANIAPILEIDNNDVEASHSLSSGTLDEEILFYINSRGLNKKEALNLILLSYLLPNSSFYENYEKGNDIEILAKKKVEDLCLI